MPVYEYRCEAFGEPMEVRARVEKYTRGVDPICPRCGTGNMKRVVSRIMIVVEVHRPSCEPGTGSGCCGVGPVV